MTYDEAKAIRSHYERDYQEAAAVIRSLGGDTGPMGMTADHVKFSPEYRAAKVVLDRTMESLRRFNTRFTKEFRTEIRAEREAKRKAAAG